MAEQDLIKPHKSSADLIADMRSADPNENEVAVWWLGQSGFAVKIRDAMIYIDPYLTEHLTKKYADTAKPHDRMTESPLQPGEVNNADLVLSTHKHSDHMDPVTIPGILDASPGARYILPRAHAEHVLGWGVEESRLILADVDIPITQSGVTVLPQPAAHESLDYIGGAGYPYMSYIVLGGAITLYHSGDTIPYRGMAGRIAGQSTDVAFLPINGRDAERHALGTPGNTTIEEALCLSAVAGVKMLVPHHYDMFTFNTVKIEDFESWAREAYPDQSICVMQCGRRYVFSKDGDTVRTIA